MNWIKRVLSLWNVENIKVVRRIIVSVVGATVLLIGIALLVLPGPAFIVIPIGLAILATEYAWARHWLEKFVRSPTVLFPAAALRIKTAKCGTPFATGRMTKVA